MIRISNLQKAYGSQILFTDVNLTLGDREKIGIIGRNGSGKSTFLQMIKDREQSVDGHIEYPDSLVISSLEQHLNFQKNQLLEQVCTALPPGAYTEEWKAQSILMGLGFSAADFERSPFEFSSGFQIRIRLAEALVTNSHVLILDEPTNYLDVLSIRWLSRFLRDWSSALFLVTHDRHFMEEVVTHTIAIHRSRMRKMRGGPQKLMNQILRDEEVFEKTRKNQEKKQKKTEEFIRTFRAGARSAGLVQSRIKSLEKQELTEKLLEIPDIHFRFKAETFRGDRLLQAHSLSFEYEKGKNILQDFSLNAMPGDKIAVIGPNGKGKSTLLRLLSGRLTPTGGTMKTYPELRIGYFGSDSIQDLHPKNTLLEEFRLLPHKNEQELRGLCGSLLFSGDAVKKTISQISGGEKARVCLGKAMLHSSHILILDEPTNHLDMESCAALTEALKAFKGAVIFVSHDEEMISGLANKLVIFDRGGISVREQSYADFLLYEGWADEEDEGVFKFAKRASENKQQYLETKEQKKRLRWLKNRQLKLHDSIEKLELHQKALESEFASACERKDVELIKTMVVKLGGVGAEIDQAYAELEEVMDEEKLLNPSSHQPPKSLRDG